MYLLPPFEGLQLKLYSPLGLQSLQVGLTPEPSPQDCSEQAVFMSSQILPNRPLLLLPHQILHDYFKIFYMPSCADRESQVSLSLNPIITLLFLKV